jgi:hypothetical protein
VFSDFYEMHLSLALVVLLLLVLSFAGGAMLSPQRWRVLCGVLGVAAIYGAVKGVSATLAWLRLRDEMRPTSLLEYGTWDQVERFQGLLWVIPGALLLAGVLFWRQPRSINWHLMTCGLLTVGFVALVTALGVQIRNASAGAVVSARNFYGVLSVFEYDHDGPDSRYYLLQHGRITHGMQFASPHRAREITSYFGSSTGLGLALRQFPRQQNQRIGLLGLGVGTVTAYGKPGDYIRIYEINPQVKQIAEDPFTYIARSEAKVEIVMGDGRLSLENEPPQNFDILIMDAFSSDAVPVHLLTKEAFAIYQRHLKPDGVILVNISNRYLDLRPVVENAARAFNFKTHTVDSEDGGVDDTMDGGWWLYASTWMILSRNEEFMNHGALRYAATPPAGSYDDIPLWTDDYTSMFRILQ